MVNNIANVRWDRGRLVQVSLLPTRQFHDAFIIRPVPPNLCYNVAFVQGMVGIPRAYTRVKLQGDVDPILARNVKACELKCKEGKRERGRGSVTELVGEEIVAADRQTDQ